MILSLFWIAPSGGGVDLYPLPLFWIAPRHVWEEIDVHTTPLFAMRIWYRVVMPHVSKIRYVLLKDRVMLLEITILLWAIMRRLRPCCTDGGSCMVALLSQFCVVSSVRVRMQVVLISVLVLLISVTFFSNLEGTINLDA